MFKSDCSFLIRYNAFEESHVIVTQDVVAAKAMLEAVNNGRGSIAYPGSS
jgi:hypothetical protein